MCQSMVDIQPVAAEIRRGIKKRKIEGKKLQGKNTIAPRLHRAAIITLESQAVGCLCCHKMQLLTDTVFIAVFLTNLLSSTVQAVT